MTPSDKCFAIIKNFEQFRPTAYKPTRKDVWTCGWGHTHGVIETTTCDHDQAQEWLEDDMSVAVEAVNKHVTVPMTQNQFDALVSLVFNIGEPNFTESTLLRKLNDRDYGGAASEFLKWDDQAHVELPGLERRREQEKALFLTP